MAAEAILAVIWRAISGVLEATIRGNLAPNSISRTVEASVILCLLVNTARSASI